MWFIWRRGLRGPEFAIIVGDDEDTNPAELLTIVDKRTKISEPVLLSDEEAELPIAELIKRHPPPTQPVDDDISF
jgi:hypothetical protein